MTLGSLFSTYTVCTDQYSTTVNDPTPWYKDFDMLALNDDEFSGYQETPTVEAEKSGLWHFLKAAGIISNAMGAWGNINSGYYFFFAGSALGSLIGNLITGLDQWLSLGLIPERKPWLVYKNP